MLARVVLAFLLAAPIASVALVPTLAGERHAVIAIRMWSSVGGVLQVYFDTGDGFHESISVRTQIEQRADAVDYEIPIARGVYRALRIDPGVVGGRYILESVAIRAADGRAIAQIPLTALQPEFQMEVDEQSESRLIVDAPPGAFDPRLLYQPPTPLDVRPPAEPLAWRLAMAGLAFLGALLVVLGAERACSPAADACARGLRSATQWGAAHPWATVLVVATIATIASTYPVLFFDRSFVSPNNGPVFMLYDQAPFVPGSNDRTIEDTRGSDVGAMMWAFVPYSKVQRQAIAHGEWPLWNRSNASGRTLWGQGQSFLFDPLHWLTLVSPDLAAGWDLKFVAHRLVFAWGIGVAVLVATGAWRAAATAALVAPFLAIFTYRFNHPASFAPTYMAWTMVGWFLLARATDRRQASLAGIIIALTSSLLLLASPPKEATLLVLAAHATGLAAIVFQGGTLRTIGMRAACAAAAGATFLLITTPHWLPFLDALRESWTASDAPQVFIAARAFALGFVLGPLMPGIAFVGINLLIVPLAAAVACHPLTLARHRMLVATGLGTVALFSIAFGIVPVQWMTQVPLLGRIGHVYDIALIGASVLGLLTAAVGVDAMRTSSRAGAGLAALTAASVVAWLAVRIGVGLSFERFEPWLIAGVGGTAATIPLLMRAAAQQPRRLLPVVACCGAIVAVLLPSGLQLETGFAPIDRVLAQPRPRVALDGASAAVEAIHRDQGPPVRVNGLDLSLFAGTTALYGLEGTAGPDALAIPAYEALVDAGGMKRSGLWHTMVESYQLAQVAPLLDLLNVGILVGRSEALPRDLPVEPMTGPDYVQAVRRPSVWPRAFFVDAVSTYGNVAEFMSQVRASGAPMAAVEATDAAAVEATQMLRSGSGHVVPADRYVLTTNATGFHVRTPAAGIVVLTEAYLPRDFIVTLNGDAVPYFRVNHAFKGVRVPSAGDWNIRFEYRPARWTPAWIAFGGGVLLVIALAVVALRPLRATIHAPSTSPAPSAAPAWDTFDAQN